MPRRAHHFISTLLLSSSPLAISKNVDSPIFTLTSFLAAMSFLSRTSFADETTAASTCTSTDSADESCSNSDTPQEFNNNDREADTSSLSPQGFLHEVPWEGDPSTKPIWWSYSYGELFDYLKCSEILPGYATIFEPGEYIYKVENHTLDPMQIQNLTAMWDEVYTKYKAEVNLSPVGSSKKVVVVPSEIGDAGSDKGRGIFVTEKVSKGSLVINTDSDSIGIFKDGHTWRQFVATLPAYTGCNVIEWSWVQEFTLENEEDVRNGLTIMTAWDESNLLNNADWEDSEEDPNVKCGTPPEGWPDKVEEEGEEWGPCQFHYYAIKDLEVGDEILMAYSEFEDFSRDWPRMGLPIEYGLEEPMVGGGDEVKPPKMAPPDEFEVV